MPFKPAYYQNIVDRLNTAAQKRPLNAAQQRTMSVAQKRLGPQMPPQTVPDYRGDTSVPNMNTIGAMPPVGTGGPGVPVQNVQSTVDGMPPPDYGSMTMKKGGKVKKMASGGMTSKASSASRRADGIAQRGKTRGKYI